MPFPVIQNLPTWLSPNSKTQLRKKLIFELAKATEVAAQIVFEALNGLYDVECFIGDINPSGKTMIHTKSDLNKQIRRS